MDYIFATGNMGLSIFFQIFMVGSAGKLIICGLVCGTTV